MLSFIQEHWAEANNFWAFRDLFRLFWALRNSVSLLWALRNSVSLFWTLRDLLRLLWALKDSLDCLRLSEIFIRSPELYWTFMSIKDDPVILEVQCSPEIPEQSVLKYWCRMNLMVILVCVSLACRLDSSI